ncbi:MAG: hypothetical protein QXW39_02945 [Candidatus Bathyarchaeia archaeon]
MGKNENEGERSIITIPQDLYKEAKKWAELWGCTAEEFITSSIEKMIEEEKAKMGVDDEMEELKRLALKRKGGNPNRVTLLTCLEVCGGDLQKARKLFKAIKSDK